MGTIAETKGCEMGTIHKTEANGSVLNGNYTQNIRDLKGNYRQQKQGFKHWFCDT